MARGALVEVRPSSPRSELSLAPGMAGGRDRGDWRDRERRDVCYRCDRPGHIARNCPGEDRRGGRGGHWGDSDPGRHGGGGRERGEERRSGGSREFHR